VPARIIPIAVLAEATTANASAVVSGFEIIFPPG
jgi:hypothetical protein